MVFSEGDKCWNGPDRSLKVYVFNFENYMQSFLTVLLDYFVCIPSEIIRFSELIRCKMFRKII